ncbi:MAG: hypothetical protein ABI640_07935 [Gammaproteobacteria bacterium]
MSETGRNKSHSNVVSGTFFGYSAERVAEWCSVSVRTATRWKRGLAMPSPQALLLFELHRDRKILASPEWDGWIAKGALLVDPEGNETTQGQLRAYFSVYQLVRELTRGNSHLAAVVDELIVRAG